MSSPRNRTHSPSDLPTDFKPDWAKAPGAVILAELKARGLTQAEFALRTSLSAKHINRTLPLLWSARWICQWSSG